MYFGWIGVSVNRAFPQDMLRVVAGMINEPDKKITPRAWEKELSSLQASLDKTQKPYAELITQLSAVEVLEYNCINLERMLSNENHDKNHDIARSKYRNDQSL